MFHFLRLLFGHSSKLRDDEESAPLLHNDSQLTANTPSSTSDFSKPSYGSPPSENFTISKNTVPNKDEKEESSGKEASKELSGIAYVRRFALFVPYIWPSNNRVLQLNLLGIFVCLALLRVLVVLAPYQLGVVVNLLGTSSGQLPIRQILLYLVFRWVDSAGLIEMVKAYLWIPIEQNAEKTLVMAAYNRIMTLSSDFHDNRKSGELYASVEQGVAIHSLFDQVLFEVAPIFFDLVVACVYLSYLFGWYMSLVVCTVCVAYFLVARYFTKKQASFIKAQSEAKCAENQVLYDSVGSWISVCYFNNQGYEEERYMKAVTKRLTTVRALNFFFYLGTMCKESVVEIGYGGACLLAAYQVFKGSIGVESFVVLLNYWARFTGPLDYFGYLQRHLQRSLVEAEQLLELLKTEPTVKDGAAEFQFGNGAIEFEGVHFSYDGTKSIINDLNFSAFPGQKIALVGETGCGKSTILKLLFRLYDVGSGSVKIDGQDLRDVTLKSLRSCIGIVPQNPVLFNDTVMNNVRYSKLDAADEQVIEACKAAAFHEKILTFTNGYASMVGENGVKLSGGEVQRLAIARAILMDPKIILLDEATSAVDCQTEALIQTALRRLSHGRTAFCIAHRLSTVMDADVILVVKDGSIAEQGSPKELIKQKGKFFDLWSLQNMRTE